MPWKQVIPVDERRDFVMDVLRGLESISELCDRYGVRVRSGFMGDRRVWVHG